MNGDTDVVGYGGVGSRDGGASVQLSAEHRQVAREDEAPLLSIVVPVHNEEGSLPLLRQRLCAVLAEIGSTAEILLVDDGSSDDSLAVMERIAAEDSRFRAISLSRNFGHQVALTAGFDLCRGSAVITMDADLQHPPELIPQMLDLWRQGYDVVYGVMRSRDSETRRKRWTSDGFYWLLSKLVDVEMPANAGDFRLVDRQVVDVLRSMPERNRYLRGLFAWMGFRQTGIEYDCAPREKGSSSYTLTKMVRLGLNAVVGFSTLPLRVFLTFGAFAALAAMVLGVSSLAVKLLGLYTVPGWTTVVVAATFLGGMQLLVIGLMGEYVGRIYDEVRQRPLYLLRQTSDVYTRKASTHLPRSSRLGGSPEGDT